MGLKPANRHLRETYSYLVKYEINGERFGMFVWGENIDDAKRDFKKHVKGAIIIDVEMKWPEDLK